MLKNVFRHFNTITKHRHTVIRHCFRAGIGFRGLFHDLSKYSPREFLYGVRYYQGVRSPNAGEREDKGYSDAWMHHKGRNRHHYEYWNDYNPVVGKVLPVKMPVRFFKEMVCDRIAASKTYNGADYTDSDSVNYLRGELWKMEMLIHPETLAKLDFVLSMLAEKGEDEMFAYLRNMKDY